MSALDILNTKLNQKADALKFLARKSMTENLFRIVGCHSHFEFILGTIGVLKLTDFGFAKETLSRDTLQTPCYTPYYVGKF